MTDRTYQCDNSPSSSTTFFIWFLIALDTADSPFQSPLTISWSSWTVESSEGHNSLAPHDNAVSPFLRVRVAECDAFLRQLCKPNKSHNPLTFHVLVCYIQGEKNREVNHRCQQQPTSMQISFVRRECASVIEKDDAGQERSTLIHCPDIFG
jgi:hypothetical protein